MKRQPLILAAVLLAVVALVALKPRTAPAPPVEAASGTAAEQAIAAAQYEEWPVLLSFRSDSCIPCKAMGGILAELQPKYEGRVAFIDISLEPDTPDMALCEQYQIRVKPTTILLAADGTVLETKLGVWEPAELAARLEQAVNR